MIFKILCRNVFRHKLRTLLTVCSVIVAILAFGMLRTVIDAWYAGVEAASPARLITRNSISLIFPLPLAYLEKIRGIKGVKTVSYGNWFGGNYIDEKHFFANFAIDAKSYLRLYPEYVLSDSEKIAFLRNRKGCIAGQRLAKRFGWKVGDTVILIGTIFPGEWEFLLTGIYHGRDKTADETIFFFHWDYFNERLKVVRPSSADKVGFYIVGVTHPEIAARTAEVIDKTFENSIAETHTETEKEFQMGYVAMTEAILNAIKLVSLVIIIIILVVVANTMAMSVRERMSEYAIFKTLGFWGRHIAILIIGESLMITFLGGVIGIILTFPVVKGFSRYVGDYFPVFHVNIETLYLDLMAMVIVGVMAGIFPAWNAITVRIAESLRRIG